MGVSAVEESRFYGQTTVIFANGAEILRYAQDVLLLNSINQL